jgi:Family of unknown function (DUF6101)
MEAGRLAAGSSRTLRLDPFSLPARFEAVDDGADGRARFVDLHSRRVVVRRCVRGMLMAISLPVAAFRGVSIRLHGKDDERSTAIAVVLEHRDPALSLPLMAASEDHEIVADWQSWGRVLGLPLLIGEHDGTLREPFARIGALRIDEPTWRRRRRSAIARRRPRLLFRRRAATWPDAPVSYRGEREIIARN